MTAPSLTMRPLALILLENRICNRLKRLLPDQRNVAKINATTGIDVAQKNTDALSYGLDYGP